MSEEKNGAKKEEVLTSLYRLKRDIIYDLTHAKQWRRSLLQNLLKDADEFSKHLFNDIKGINK